MLVYILKKDLPFAKKGDKIKLTNKLTDRNCINVKDKDGIMWEIGFYEDLERLIEEGWIQEEAKEPEESIKKTGKLGEKIVTKSIREKTLMQDKEIILNFLKEHWEGLIGDDAISEKEDYADGDTRRLVNNYIRKTEIGNVDITFEFKIHTRPSEPLLRKKIAEFARKFFDKWLNNGEYISQHYHSGYEDCIRDFSEYLRVNL